MSEEFVTVPIEIIEPEQSIKAEENITAEESTKAEESIKAEVNTKVEESRKIKQNAKAHVKRRKAHIIRRVFLTLLTTGLIIFGFWAYIQINRVQPAFSSIVYELGEEISRDPEDYVLGPERIVEQGELDLSQVDQSKTGTYQAFVRCGKNEFQYEIIIQDTIAPTVILRNEPVCLALDREYSVKDLVRRVEDADSFVTLYVQDVSGALETVNYHNTGVFVCIVVAMDTSGNSTSVSVPVTVGEAPVISGARDIYVAMGSQVDYLEEVTARDETDGNLTGRLTVDDSEVELTREGTYKLTYRVENDLGIDTVSSVDVIVTSAEGLQELIGSRQVNRTNAKIIGAINPYDAGFSDHDDISDTLEYMRPALVQLYHAEGRGYTAGSGYIMEITEDTIYICSNRHVIECYNGWDVYFFDGTRVRGRALGYSDKFDVGVATVSVSDVPEELMERLMTIHIDMEYWSGLDDQRIDVGLERVDRIGGILHTSTGIMLKVKQYFGWYDRENQTEVTLVLEHGDSGSAVMDGYGNLIGMAFAYTCAPRRYWCVPLDGILESYEEITGREVYTYSRE